VNTVKDRYAELVEAARAAVTKAFLTSPGGTAYGSAVLTSSGSIFDAGQYSSWNHITNIHAEQLVLAMAAMADEPDVVALALASTSPDEIPSPCGCCRQVMSEHSRRTGRDFDVLLAHRSDPGFERIRASELISAYPWQAASISRSFSNSSEIIIRKGSRLHNPTHGIKPEVGDHVILADRSIGMVWDDSFYSDKPFVKVKYAQREDGAFVKVPHAFSTPSEYRLWLNENMSPDTSWPLGPSALVPENSSIAGVIPTSRISEYGDAPEYILQELDKAGVDVSQVKVTGSRGNGLSTAASDWDIIVPALPENISCIQEQLATLIFAGKLTIPDESGTWKLLDRLYPGGKKMILEQRRFCETVEYEGVKVAIIFVPETQQNCIFDKNWQIARGTVHGIIEDACFASYKRSTTILRVDAEKRVKIISLHKLANLLRRGDRISAKGWLVTNKDETRLLQCYRDTDCIRWFSQRQ
jgi:cytidine deaminase